MIDEPAIRGNSVEPVLSCLLRLPRSFKPEPLRAPLYRSPAVFPLRYFVFPFLAPPTLSPSVLNKSVRYLIVTGPRWKVRPKFPFYYLRRRERASKLRDSIK